MVLVVNQVEVFNVRSSSNCNAAFQTVVELTGQFFPPLNYSWLHVSFLTKNSKLVSCRLDSWPCRGP